MTVTAIRGWRMRWLRTLIVCAGFWVCMHGPVVAQSVTIGPLEAIGFDYADADLAAYEVNRFEIAYDGASTWTPIGLPVASTVGGVTTYKVIPTQTSGTHTLLIHTCNQAGCGPASLPFDFALLSAPSKAPSNVRKIPR